jgi:hypothetical protein
MTSSRLISATTFLGSLADRVRDVLDAVQSWASDLSAVDVLLVAVVGSGLYWAGSTVRAMTNLGPVDVTTLDFDGKEDDKPKLHALTALLRERLAKSGLLPPPAVPAGSPQTNLIAAVETSGAPQAIWVAKLLEILPQPPRAPEFKLSGALLGPPAADDSDDDANADAHPPPAHAPAPDDEAAQSCGLAYWLQPKRQGRMQVDRIEGQSTHADAIELAATDIFLSISRDAVHLFPAWSRWQSADAFRAYLNGIEKRVAGEDHNAEGWFLRAAAAEPRNILPRLQLANLHEKHAWSVANTGSEDETLEQLTDQADVLREYLALAVEQPDLVTARYRASILASMLATDSATLTADASAAIASRVGVNAGANLSTALHELAAAESAAVLELLRWTHIALYERRFRHRYEPRGHERRELRRTAAISKHAVKVRDLGERDDLQARGQVLLWRLAVRGLYLGVGRASVGWNAHYNAACFYALLLERELALQNENAPEEEEHGDGT